MNSAKIRNFYFNLKKNACGCDDTVAGTPSIPQGLSEGIQNLNVQEKSNLSNLIDALGQEMEPTDTEENSLDEEIDNLEHEMDETPEHRIQYQKQSIVIEIKTMFFNLNKIENICSEINSMKPVLTQIVMNDSFQDLDTVIDEISSKINSMYDITDKMREIEVVSDTLQNIFFPYPD